LLGRERKVLIGSSEKTGRLAGLVRISTRISVNGVDCGQERAPRRKRQCGKGRCYCQGGEQTWQEEGQGGQSRRAVTKKKTGLKGGRNGTLYWGGGKGSSAHRTNRKGAARPSSTS